MSRAVALRRDSVGLLAAMGWILFASAAPALEAFDGRLQAHGFVEIQMRALSNALREDIYLSQWYNVLNVEFEADIAPDGFGPFDLISAFVRVEGRYDCVYSNGCGTGAINFFGNDASGLPERLRDGLSKDFAGTIDLHRQERLIKGKGPATAEELFEGLFESKGPDPADANLPSDARTQLDDAFVTQDPPLDDPARYALDSVLDFKFAAKFIPVTGSTTGGAALMAPWLPKNEIQTIASLTDRANPFRGRVAPVIGGAAQRTRFFEGDFDERLFENGGLLGDPDGIAIGPRDPAADFTAQFTPELATACDRSVFGAARCMIDVEVVDRDGVPYIELRRVENAVDIPDDVVARHTALLAETYKEDIEDFRFCQPGNATCEIEEQLERLVVDVDPDRDGHQSSITQSEGPFDLSDIYIVDTSADTAANGTPLNLRVRARESPYYMHLPGGAASLPIGEKLEGSDRIVVGVRRVIPGYENLNEEGFGGDYSGILSFFASEDQDGNVPNGPSCGADDGRANSIDLPRTNVRDPFRCPSGAQDFGRSLSLQRALDGVNVADGLSPLRNILIAGGTGELPLRPATDRSVLDTSANPGNLNAQGIYYPSAGLRRALSNPDRFDSLDFNVTERQRSWNRGASQQQTKELKEAYLDLEFLESRLWLRVGRQTIVWGKTELFPTTDVINPRDFALASIASLEETRIPVWSAKAIYSLYDVGPLEDVRIELAFNFDEFTPNDLGACGEPYTIDLVCGLTLGLAAHGFVGLGVAGQDRPPNPWDDFKEGIEVGGRIEWRWDRFSFALVDFYGYDDFPHAEPIFFFERNVDLETGRPLVTRFASGAGGPQGSKDCRTPQVVINPETKRPVLDAAGNTIRTTTANLFAGVQDSTGQLANDFGVGGIGNPVPLDFAHPKNAYSSSPRGIGTDPKCLKGGGAAGFQAENALGGLENALENHPANQQFHAFVCLATLGISNLDVQRCALNLFGSNAELPIIDFPLMEFFTLAFSGEPAGQIFIQAATNSVRTMEDGVPGPSVHLNRDRGPICVPADPDDATDLCVIQLQAGGWDGIITASSPLVNLPDAGAPTFLPFVDPVTGETEFVDCTKVNRGPCRVFSFHYSPEDFLTLDSTLSNEQKALLGCGPFFGTRCDSSDAIVLYDALGVEQDVPLIPAGGGIDFLNAEASFLLQSWPGIEGTDDRFWTPRLRAAFDAADADLVRVTARRPSDPLYDPGLIQECADRISATRNPRFCRIFRPIDESVGAGVPVRFLSPGHFDRQPLTDGSFTLALTDSFKQSLGGKRVVPTWLTTAESLPQPGAMRLGEYNDIFGTHWSLGARHISAQPCTVFNETDGTLEILPGCRGIDSIDGTDDKLANGDPGSDGITDIFIVTFQEDYLPSVDGCVFGGSGRVPQIGGIRVEALDSDGQPVSGQLKQELESCADDSDLAQNSTHRLPVAGAFNIQQGEAFGGARAFFHPLAGCLPDEDAASLDIRRNVCPYGVNVSDSQARNFAAELAGMDPNRGPENVFIFTSEGAALSFNVLMFLTALSCNGDVEADIMADPECFDPEDSFSPARCSYAAPQLCGTIAGLLGAAGPARNTIQAGGSNGFGRRVFLWQSGGEVLLAYDRRNTLGLSADFAEDVTKTNWGMEFTWVTDRTVLNNNSLNAIGKVQDINLTVSVDRPTFINFLNPNRTFFFNSQWFFRYTTNWDSGMGHSGPWNVLATFAVLAGYFQDRLLPQFITIYDFQSRSGGFLPSVSYRFTENFSATLGILAFYGRTQSIVMPLRSIGPYGNRAGKKAYENPEENFISVIRQRDEIFMRLRWTF
ncbi:MAG: DUF1302 family protein [Myxococcota bacterium]